MTVLYVVRQKLLLVLSGALQGVFLVAAIVAILGLFWDAPFTFLAKNTLEQGGTLSTIRKIDGTISLDAVKNVGTSIYDKVLDLLGQKNNQTKNSSNTQNTGIIERDVYPTIVSSLAGTYRIVSTTLGVGTMIVVIYLSYTITGATEIEILKKRITILEKEIHNITPPIS